MHEWLVVWMKWVADWGYGGVVLLMSMESSVFPVPSEVVVPPAAILAARGDGGMNMWGVVLAGTLGSYLGSCITYAAALWLGRPLVLRYGKWFFVSQANALCGVTRRLASFLRVSFRLCATSFPSPLD